MKQMTEKDEKEYERLMANSLFGRLKELDRLFQGLKEEILKSIFGR